MLTMGMLGIKRHGGTEQAAPGGAAAGMHKAEMVRVAVLSNPLSSGNKSLLPKVEAFCERHPELTHYIGDPRHIDRDLTEIAATNPHLLVISGGDGTVQAVLTALVDAFGTNPPPIAILPSGKTNLIAQDLGAGNSPVEALERVLEIVRNDMSRHIVYRNLMSLDDGTSGRRPVLGMFLGGAGLADIILYCRHKIYPMGMSNRLSHAITLVAAIFSVLTGLKSRYMPPQPSLIGVSTPTTELRGRFQVVLVTTLHSLLGKRPRARPDTPETNGALKLLMVERRPMAIMRAVFGVFSGNIAEQNVRGIHVEAVDEIRIEGNPAQIILDGEAFEATSGRAITLRSALALPFLSID